MPAACAPCRLPEATRGDDNGSLAFLSPFVVLEVEAVGRWFEAHAQRRRHKKTLSQSDVFESSSSSEESDVEDEEDDPQLLMTLDPKQWKDQDHYKVLGLGNLRHKASHHDIKKSYKRKVLKHHPDKRKNTGGQPRKSGDDDYFTCITRAYEILGDPKKRRSYDSVDPDFDDGVPSDNANSRENFYDVFGKAFDLNSRWSCIKPVPKIGDESYTNEDLDNFYEFWYRFDSWREYSYLDEEEKEKGQDRDERRWIDKQNKDVRKKRRKEEISRIRLLVDTAYTCDPRIKKIKEEEKQKKAAEKRAKQEAARIAAEEKEKERAAVLEKERMAKEKEEEEARIKAQAAKKEREALKKVLKKERKVLRDTCKQYNYFSPAPDQVIKQMEELEKLCDRLSLEDLQSLNKEMTNDGSEEAKKTAFLKKVQKVNAVMASEKEEMRRQQAALSEAAKGDGTGSSRKWSDDDLPLLIKAVTLFPPGTVSRWEVIASFLNQHSTATPKFNSKDVIFKVKDLQKMDPSAKAEANQKAFDKFARSSQTSSAADEAKPSERFSQVGEAAVPPGMAPWRADEQKLLEQALKTFPANSPERWDKIAQAVPSRSKKECMLRYKELVELVKAKKTALAQVQAKSKKI